jgi:uncharacterized OB-fold protein
MTGPSRSDLPTIENESRPFWDGAKDGKLMIARCDSCQRAHHYPRPFCPFCWSEDVRWEQASGRATLYTYSTVFVNDLPPFKEQLPYIAAVVDLEEGPRLMTRLIGIEPDQLQIGMPLIVAFEAISDDVTAPVFRAAA